MAPRVGAAGADDARTAHHRSGFGSDAAARRPACVVAALLVLLGGVARADETGGGDGTAFGSVVRARRASAPREDPIAAASVVEPERTPRSLDALPDVLGEVPGLTVTRLGGLGAYSTLSLRGSTPDQVRVYLDGVPLNQAVGGAVDLSTLPLADVERIEIYRGTTPIAFGESALGGIVSVTTRDPDEHRLVVDAGGGSFGTRFAGVSGALALPGLRLSGGLHASTADNDFTYRSDNGTALDPSDDTILRRRNSAMTQLDGVLRAGIPLGETRQLRFGLIGFFREQGVPGAGLFPTHQAGLSTLRAIAYAGYEGEGDLGEGSSVNARLFAAALRQRFHDPLPEIGLVPSATDDLGATVGLTANASVQLADRLVLGTLVEARGEAFLPKNAVDAAPTGAPASRLVGSLGAELRWTTPVGIELLPSVRLEGARDVTSGRSRWRLPLEPSAPIVRVLPVIRVGGLVPLGEAWSLRSNVGRYARLPSTSELYGDTGFLLGNPALRPESGWNADLGVVWRTRQDALRLEVEAFAFGALVDDLIEWRRTAQWVVRAENVTRARVLGLESALRLEWGRHLRATAQATLTDARDTGAIDARQGNLLPLRPPVRAYLRPEWRRIALGPVEAGLYAELDFTAGNHLDHANLVLVPARLLVHAGLFVDLPGGLRLVVNGANLGDSPVSDVSGYPLPGRAVFASLQWNAFGQEMRP